MKATREMADRLVSEGLVKANHKDGFTLFKYARKVFYKNLWTPELELFRGTVFKDHKLVVEPMRKVYNYGENGIGTKLPTTTPVIIDYKVNGFMLNVTVLDGGLLFSTTGSLDSEFVNLGKDMFYKHISEQQIQTMLDLEGITFTFEVVSMKDPHVIPEELGLHLLKIGNKSPADRNKFAKRFGFKHHNLQDTTLGKVLELAKTAKHEGWVVYSQEGDLLFKLKTNYYLTTKFLMRSKKASELLFSPNAKEEFKDEEFFNLIDFLQFSGITKEDWDAYTEQQRRQVIEFFFAVEGAF